MKVLEISYKKYFAWNNVCCYCLCNFATQGTRKIPVSYAKRVVGRKVYGGQSTHIPLKVILPVLCLSFCQSVMFIPSTIATFFSENVFMQGVMRWFSFDHLFIG